MGNNTDPHLRGGNTVAATDLKFGKVSDVFAEAKLAEMASALEAARQSLNDKSEQSVREWGLGTKREYKVTLTERTYNNETHIAGAPAKVAYRSVQRKAHARAELDHQEDDSNTNRTLSSVLSVTFNPEARDPGVFTFDFETKDPVEELVRTGQNVIVDGTPLDIHEGTALAMRIITDASQSVIG